jgi:hypothetical protein
LLGNQASAPAQDPAQHSEPAVHSPDLTRPVNLRTEISAPMFRGTVFAIDRTTLRVTVRTDFRRLAPGAVEHCEALARLRIGDRVRLDVDVQGIVQALEKTGARRTAAPARKTGHCPETSA